MLTVNIDPKSLSGTFCDIPLPPVNGRPSALVIFKDFNSSS